MKVFFRSFVFCIGLLFFLNNVYAQSITPSAPALTALSTTYGNASSEISFTFTATGLGATENVSITAPGGFQVSLTSGSGFATSVSVAAVAGAITTTTIYARLSASATVAGSPYSGNIVLNAPTSVVTANKATVSSTVSAKALTMSGLTVPGSKIYNATTTAVVSGTPTLQSTETIGTGTPSDGKPYTGDDVSITGTAIGTYNTKDVSTATTVTYSGLTLAGLQAGNYTLTIQSSSAATITAKALTMSGLSVPASKIYNATTAAVVSGSGVLQSAEGPGTGTTADGIPYTGDVVSISGSATGTYNSKDVATASTVTYGGLTLAGAQSGNYSLTIQSSSGATITAKDLTITGVTANDKAFDNTTTASLSGSPVPLSAEGPGTGSTSDGKPYTGDVVNVASSPTATFASVGPGPGISVTVTGYTLGGAQAGNYNPIQPTGLTASIFSTEPTLICNTMTFSSITNTTMTVGWTIGTANGGFRILVARQGASPIAPADGTTYTPNSVIGSVTAGEITAAGSYVVYSGTGSSVALTGFTANASYTFNLYEFNTSGPGDENYLTSSFLTGTQIMRNEPANHVTSFVVSATSSVITLNWSGSIGSPSPTAYLVLGRDVTSGGSFVAFSDGGAVPGNDVNLNSSNNGVQTITFGTNTFNGWTNVATGNQYEFEIVPYTTGGSLTPDYKTSPTIPVVTVFAEPSASASTPTFSNITPTSIDVTVGGGTGVSGGYLVIRKTVATAPTPPVDGNTYTVGTTPLAAGETIAYVGAAGLFTDSPPLASLATYYYTVYVYSGSGANTNYRTTSPATGNSTTLCAPPTGQATGLTFTTTSGTATIGWTPSGSADGALVLLNNAASASAFVPVSGTPYAGNLDFGSGTDLEGGGGITKSVFFAAGSSAVVTNLVSATAYTVRIYEYKTAGNCYNFTLPPTGTQSTAAANSTSALATVSASGTISSVANAIGSKIPVFSFSVTDGPADTQWTRIGGLIFRPGTGNQVTDFRDLLSNTTVELVDQHGNAQTANIVVNAADITITSIPNSGSGTTELNTLGKVKDNTTKTYTLNVWVDNPLAGSAFDGRHFTLSLAGTDVSLNTGAGTSNMLPGTSCQSGAGNGVIAVVASALTFTQQPAAAVNASTPLSPQPILKAADANGNLDLDIISATVSTPDAVLAPTSAPTGFSSGFMDFTGSGFNYANTGTSRLTVTTTSPSLSVTSTTSTVVSASTTLGASVTSMSASPLYNSTTGVISGGTATNAVLGFNLQTSGSPLTLTQLDFTSTPSPAGLVSNFKLWSNTSDSFTGATQVATSSSLTFSSLSIALSGTTKYFFLTCDVDPSFPSASPTIQFSLPAGNFTVSTGGKSGAGQTGINYTLLDITPPTVTSLTIIPSFVPNAGSITNGTFASTVIFRVTFNENVTGIAYAGGNKNFTAQTVGVGAPNPTGAAFTTSNFVDITASGISGQGLLRYDFIDKDNVVDMAGNPIGGIGFGNGDFNTSFTLNQYYSIVLPAPSTPVGGFSISTEDDIELQTMTSQGAGPQLPTHYLFMVRESQGSVPFPTITNGTLIPDDRYDLTYPPDGSYGDYSSGDGLYVLNTTFSPTVFNYSWLFKTGVLYDFIVYPYTKGTNYSDDNTQYGTPTTILNHLIGPVATNSVLTSTTVTAPIASTFNSAGNMKQVFTFNITDGLGTLTSYEFAPTKLSSLTINEDLALDNVTNWTAIIAGAELYDINSPSTFVSASSILSNQIQFSSIPASLPGDLGYVDPSNNWTGFIGSKSYGLRIYLNNGLGALTDNQVLAFKVTDASFGYNNGLGTVADHQQSSKLQAGIATSGANTISVAATKLVFTTDLPDKVGVKHPFSISPVVEAWDANNNVDKDFTGPTISLSNGAMTFTTTNTFASGKLTLSNFVFNDAGFTTVTVAKTGVTSAASSSPTGPGGATEAVISAYTSVNQVTGAGIPMATIPSITTLIPSATPSGGQLNASGTSFSFIVKDDDLVPAAEDDVLPTRINSITVSQHGNNGTATGGATFDNWANSIATGGAQLSVGGVGIGGTVTVNPTSIVFGAIPNTLATDLGYISDNGSRTYVLKIWFQNPVNSALRDIFDGEDFVFTINSTTDIPVTDASGNHSSTLSSFTAFNSGNGNNTVAVTTTQLDFITQPPTIQNYDVNLTITPVVKARDANQNLDLGYTSAATLNPVFVSIIPNTTPHTYPLSNSSFNFVGGVVNLSSVAVGSSGNGINNDHIQLRLDDSPDVGSVTSGLSNTIALTYSGNSDIVRDHSTYPFTLPTNVLYASANNQVNDITSGTGIALEQFTIRDGGGSNDTDGTATVLSAITLNVTNWQYLQRLALYDGSTEIADIAVVAPALNTATGDITFSTLAPFSVADNGTKNLTVKASFNASSILDNAVINFSVVSVTAGGVSSSFTAGASTTVPTLGTNENKIEVVATKIDFVIVPASASINVSFPVVAHARDANDNLDLDYNGAISFTGNGNTSGYTVTNAPAGPFVAGVLNYPLDNTGTSGVDEGYYFTSGTTFTQLTINGGAANTGGASVDAGSITGTSPAPGIDVKTSYDSWLYFDPSFAYTSKIPFVGMQETTLTNSSNSVELARLILSDGGAPGSAVNPLGIKNLPLGSHNDIDGAFTKIDQFTISLTNFTDIRQIVLFDALGNKIGSDQSPAATVTFSGLSGVAALTAADNDVAKFYIRASFNQTIGADLDQVNIQITNVVWSSGSQFPLTDGTTTEGGIDGAGAGGDSSDPSQNYIDVVATSLDFVTQPSTYAGTNEPVGPSYTTAPLPSTSSAVVHARDKFANLDLEFNYTASQITITGGGPVSGSSFVNGILNLDGLKYTSAGDGTLTVVANGINSSVPGIGNIGNSTPGQMVNVVNVAATSASIVTPPNLKGGTPGALIFGVTFRPDYSTTTEPSLKKFIFSFDFPYETSTTTIFKNFKVRQGSIDVTTMGATVTTGSSPSVGTDKDLVIVDWGANPPVPLYDPSTGNAVPVTFYLIADVDITAKIGTQNLTPQLIDAGYSSNTDKNIIVTKGTAIASVIGQTYSFASTRPPVLLTDANSLTRPFNGQLNVNKALTQIDLNFDVQVWSLDGVGEIYNRTTNAKVADLKALNGDYTTAAGLTPTVNPLSFNINFLVGESFQDDGLYYVTLKKGSFDNLSGKGTGISDDGFNYFGGISSNATLFFKISSPNPPVLSGALSAFNNLTTGTFSTKFDQRGTAYYLVLQSGSTPPTNADIASPTAYTISNPGAVVTNGNYTITQVNDFQTVAFNANLVAGATYDVWIFAKNDATPIQIATSAPYGSNVSNFAVGGAGPTLKLILPTLANIKNSYQPAYSLCPDSFFTLTDPIIIGENNTSDFNLGITVQDFNILLPPGFEFDGINIPSVQLVGADFDQTSLRIDWINNTVVNISYKNISSLSLDKIIITNLKVMGVAGSNPGNIKRFAGNALLGSTTTLATISNLTTTEQKFTNSYSINNDFTPFVGTIASSVITAIPDNYVDQDQSITGAIRLVPQITPANDYGITFFGGNGVTNDILSLSAVALNSAFDITMTHTDLNGCISENSVQYVVYDHKSPISVKLGSAKNGTQEPLSNPNFPLLAPSATLPNATLPRINYKDLAGYKLLSLDANIPVNAGSQIISGADWQNQVAKIPVSVNQITNDTDIPTILGFTKYQEYQWDYARILNAVSESKLSNPSSTITVDPYDNFKFTTVNNNPYWTGGSLGKVEFTGTFQNTADLSVLVPFRQEVELFVPPIPVLEVDQSNQPVKGVTTYCEFGGGIIVNGYPAAAAGSSTGTFAIYDALTNTLLQTAAPNSAFVDNGNGTATIYPYLLSGAVNIGITNGYKDIKITYTYQENNSPSVGTSSILIRISPNPVAKFDQNSDQTVFVDNTKGLSSGKASDAKAYCAGIPITFDPTSSTIAADTKAFYNWDFGDLNSATNTATSTPSAPTLNNLYPTIGTYRAKLTVISDKGCSSINTDNYFDITVGSIPTVDFDLVGISAADQITFTDKSIALSNGSNSFSKINTVNWDYGDLTSNSTGIHQYNNPGHYITKATVTTAIGATSGTTTSPGCTRSFDRTIIVLDKKSGYYEDNFEGATTTWQYISDSLNTNGLASTQLPSWKRGTPSSSRKRIKSTPNTGTTNNNVWATGLTGLYLKNERSFLYSPALDLTGFIRPMISFDANWDLKKDGVVLEYSTDNKNVADPTKTWKTIGNNTTGVNWFNDQIIGSKPGNQPSGDFGWSGFSKDSTWVESKHELSSAIGVATALRGNVVFRFGFATQNDGGEGFAFDNFRVGERTRTILLEDFVTTNSGDATKNSLIKSEKEAILTFTNSVGIGTNVVNLNYHIGFTGNDPFNLDNPADPSARALYYNVKDVPWAFLDGVRPADALIDPKFSIWGQRAYDNQTLVLGQSDITVPTPAVNDSEGSIKFDVTVKALYDLPDNTILHVAIIEQSIIGNSLPTSKKDLLKTGESNFDFVLKKMLPNASGTKFGQALTKNSSRTFTGFEFYVDGGKLYENANDFAIVVFLQNESTKGIYQTELITNILDPTVVTGMENAELLEHVEVYPNPADNEITVRLPGLAKQSMELQLVDQVGKVVHNDSILEGTSLKRINSQGLAAGIYILQIGSGKSGVVRKKVLVVHQE